MVANDYLSNLFQILPTWLAPNLITFIGFMFLVLNFLMLSFYDFDFYASGGSVCFARFHFYFVLFAVGHLFAKLQKCNVVIFFGEFRKGLKFIEKKNPSQSVFYRNMRH